MSENQQSNNHIIRHITELILNDWQSFMSLSLISVTLLDRNLRVENGKTLFRKKNHCSVGNKNQPTAIWLLCIQLLGIMKVRAGQLGRDLCLFLCLICWSKSPVICCGSKLKNKCHSDKSACWEMFNMTAIFLSFAGNVYSTWAYKTFISAAFTEINQEKYWQKRIIY